MHLRRLLWVAIAGLLTVNFHGFSAEADFQVVNGGFEDGLSAWQATGEAHLETNQPLAGRFSAVVGPGPASLAQRIETGSGNHLTVTATIAGSCTNGWVFAVRFLDKNGQEVMRVDSLSDLKPDNTNYWKVVGEYAAKLQSMTGTGVQLVDLTALTELLYAVKKPKDFLNDPLHPNDYLARWYAQSLEAALDPAAAANSPAPESSGNNVHQIKTENESP